MSDPAAVPLPDRPDLEQLRKQAKELRASGQCRTLAEAQLAVARRHGFTSWTKLKRATEMRMLRRLIEEGEAAAARALLAASPGLVRGVFEDGSTPLHLAAGENRPELVEALVEHGAPMHAAYGKSAHSALSWALTCWAFPAAERLVSLGLEPDLFCAAGLGGLARVQAFWRDGVLRRHPSRTGSSRFDDDGVRLQSPPRKDADQVSDALYLACRCDRLEVARWLLDHGADPNWRGYAGGTCLGWAEFSGNAELCGLLRERGGDDALVDPHYRARPRVFAFMVLAGWGFSRLLLQRLTEDPSQATLFGERGTLLHAAAEGGQEASVRILLHFGADRNVRDSQGRTAAEVAAGEGHAALAAQLSA